MKFTAKRIHDKTGPGIKLRVTEGDRIAYIVMYPGTGWRELLREVRKLKIMVRGH